MTESTLWLPPSAQFKKAPPPTRGEVAKWGPDDPFVQFATLPGGSVLQFDLNRLNLSDFRQMRDHYQINANLTLLTFMIHQIDWRIECEDKRIATFIEDMLRPMWTQIIRGLAQAFWAGFSPMALQYENDVDGKSVVLDKVKDLTPELSSVNWKEVSGYTPRGSGIPRQKYKVYDGIKQSGMSHPIPVDNTLWYPLLMENGNYYGRKLLRPAFVPWFFSMIIHLYVNRYFERFGEPLPIGRADYDATYEIDGKTVTGREAMQGILTQLRNRSVVTMPSDRDENGNYDFDLEYLEGQMRGADFERYLTRLDEEMSLGLFTPILMLRTVDVGSYNLGINHMQVWMWMLNAIAADMKQYIDDYLIQKIKAFKFSPRAPRAEWKPRPLGKQDSETMRAIISAMFREGKVMPKDLEEMGQAIGLSLREVRQVVEDPAQDDPRVGRPERENDGGVSIEASLPIAPMIERLSSQVTKAYREGRFGDANAIPNLGYERQFREALIDADLTQSQAADAAQRFYSLARNWLTDFWTLGEASFDSPTKFIEAFQRSCDFFVEEALK